MVPDPPPPPPPTHVPLMEKHPPARSIPRAKVEVAPVPVTLRNVDASAPENVEVEFVPRTFKKPWMVEVPVVFPWRVVVAEPPTQRVPKTDSFVDDAPEENCWSAVQVLAFPRLSESVPDVAIAPPDSVGPVATEVTVPDPPVPVIHVVPSLVKQGALTAHAIVFVADAPVRFK